MDVSFLKNLFKKRPRRIHLDYASTTPVHPKVLSLMLPYFSEEWSNPSSIYEEGVRAKQAIESARTKLARTLALRTHDIIFTSGGTESNNLALLGFVEMLHARGRSYIEMEIISTKIEHPSIAETVRVLEERGVTIVYVDIHHDGTIDELSFKSALSAHTVLVTFAYANSEIGVVQNVKRLSRMIRAFNSEVKTDVRIHLDASQAPLWLPCTLDMLGVDMMTLDSGKCYGPKGVGVLALRHGVSLKPTMHGGGQERGRRAGTENTPLIIGCVEALVRAQEKWKSRSDAVASLRDFMITHIQKEIPEAVLNGSHTSRIANNVNISLSGIDTEFAVITLDKEGIAASTKSACGGADGAESAVVYECTQDVKRAASTIRFTLGESTTRDELIQAVKVLKNHVNKVRLFQETLRNKSRVDTI